MYNEFAHNITKESDPVRQKHYTTYNEKSLNVSSFSAVITPASAIAMDVHVRAISIKTACIALL